MKVVLWLSVAILTLILIFTILVQVFENPIKSAILGEINRHLHTKVYLEPENINFTVFSSFPYASLELKEITLMGTNPNFPNDTLLFGERVFLAFDLSDLWNQHYVIRKVLVDEAFLHIRVDKNKVGNYEFWQSSDTLPSKGTADFQIDEVTLKRFNYKIKYAPSKLFASGRIESGIFKGNFSEKKYVLKARFTGSIQALNVGKISYLKEKRLSLQTEMRVDHQKYEVPVANGSLNELAFQFSGKVEHQEGKWPASLQFDGKDIDIRSVLSLLPQKFQNSASNYESEGKFNASVNLEGVLDDWENLKVGAEFAAHEVSVTYLPLHTKLNKIQINATLKKEKHQKLGIEVSKIRAWQGQNFISGSFFLSDPERPRIRFELNGIYEAADLLAFFPITQIPKASGQLNLTMKGNLAVGGKNEKIIEKCEMEGELAMTHASLTLNENPQTDSENGKIIKIEACRIVVENNRVLIDLNLIYGNSKLKLQGSSQGVISYLILNKNKPTLDLDVNAEVLDFGELLKSKGSTIPGNDSLGQSAVSFSLPFFERVDAKVYAGKIIFNHFSGRNLEGAVAIKDKKVMTDELKMEAFEGKLILKWMAESGLAPEALKLNGKLKLEDVNIQQMFQQLENFGQKEITSENVKGKVISEIDFSASWNEKWGCNLPSIALTAIVNISNGELLGYKLLDNLSNFVSLKELQRVKFSNLSTQIGISNQVIKLDQTRVENSVLDLQISGTHSFQNIIDYRIRLKLDEFLLKKRQANHERDAELQFAEEDPENKRCLFLKMTGNVANPKIQYDRKGLTKKLGEDLKEERMNLRKILHEEFGWFKNDTASNKNGTKKGNTEFKIEFDDKKKKEAPVNDDGDF